MAATQRTALRLYGYKTLLFDTMYEANISNKTGIAVSNVRELFTDTFDGDMPMPHRNYDLTKDGRQFVMIGVAPESTPQTIVVLNWLDELRARRSRRDRLQAASSNAENSNGNSYRNCRDAEKRRAC